MDKIGPFLYYANNYIKTKRYNNNLLAIYYRRKMSQSDYIKYKRVASQLVNQKKLPPILDSSDYTSYFGYNLESTIVNKKPDLSQLIPSASQLVFSMKLNVNSCPTFIECINTNTRPNRSLTLNGNCNPNVLNTPPYVTPISPLTEKQLAKYVNLSIKASDLCLCSGI